MGFEDRMEEDGFDDPSEYYEYLAGRAAAFDGSCPEEEYEEDEESESEAIMVNASRPLCEGLKAFQYDPLWGYMDEVERVVITPQYFYAGDFSDGLAMVIPESSDHLFGFIDKSGGIVITPKYFDVDDFHFNLAPACLPGSPWWGIIDKKGEFVVKPNLTKRPYFENGLWVVQQNDNRGYVDQSGKFIVPQNYSDYNFKEGLAPVWMGERAFVDTQVTLLLPCYFDKWLVDLFRRDGFTVLHAESYGGMEQLVKELNSYIDIAIEWQRGVDCFPLNELFEKYNVRAPLFLSLNWDLKIPEKYNELGYSGTLDVPFQMADMKNKFYDVLPDNKKIILKQMSFWESQ